jgi:glycerophosphoryl diester phosphodiesterase
MKVMTKIIGHRGAAGLALENSRASLRAALKAQVDVAELDVRRTADDRLVVVHDANTGRVSPTNVTVRDKTLAELHQLPLYDGEILLELDEALDIVDTTPVIIDIKDENSADELLLTLARHPKNQASIASLHHEELRQLRRALPNIPVYVLEHLSPIEILHNARQLHATGIGLNKWLMNPLTYRLAMRYHLELYVYVVNSPLLVKFLKKLYPNVDICTDHPERFMNSRTNTSD